MMRWRGVIDRLLRWCLAARWVPLPLVILDILDILDILA